MLTMMAVHLSTLLALLLKCSLLHHKLLLLLPLPGRSEPAGWLRRARRHLRSWAGYEWRLLHHVRRLILDLVEALRGKHWL